MSELLYCSNPRRQRGSIKRVPILMTTAIIALVAFMDSPVAPDFIKRVNRSLEWMTYDWRIRGAVRHGGNAAGSTNMMALLIDEPSMEAFHDGGLGLSVSFPFPRLIYGRVVEELKTEGALAVGFDVLFDTTRGEGPASAGSTNRALGSSDAVFAQEIERAGNVVLAATRYEGQWVWPVPAFTRNATVADISAEQDADGVLRRVRPYSDGPDGRRLWHLGIVLGAKALGLDLDHAEIRPREIVLRGPAGLERRVPLDDEGRLLINWSMPYSRVEKSSLFIPYAFSRFRQDSPTSLKRYREMLRTNDVYYPAGETPLLNKIVVVGSSLVGNNLTDRGATPLDKLDFLLGKHWNVANSIIKGRFVGQSPFWLDLLIIAGLAVFSAWTTWHARVFVAVATVLAGMVVFTGLAWLGFVWFGWWIPIVTPVLGSLGVTHVSMVTYLVVVEQNERRRVRAVFSKIVAPEVVTTLLESEKLALGGARREISVYFADIRGFTEMTDTLQARAEEFVRGSNFTKEQAEEYFHLQAAETLETVNLYLAAIADTIKKHNGTLDKYIGDCVMAFWGAPVQNEKHALACVRAAIEAQRLIYALNRQRFAENQKREKENAARAAEGLAPLAKLPMLTLGTGINTGVAIVGLMGSDAHILNYTVFGREVNLASRLESLSGRGRIIIGETTFRHLERDDPALASVCVEQPRAMIKGFSTAVRSFEVPWRENPPSTAGSIYSMPVAPPKA